MLTKSSGPTSTAAAVLLGAAVVVGAAALVVGAAVAVAGAVDGGVLVAAVDSIAVELVGDDAVSSVLESELQAHSTKLSAKAVITAGHERTRGVG
ncbi:MAG: hypothetical protein ACR2QE_15190 [Acidimicrobiales bacterium]